MSHYSSLKTALPLTLPVMAGYCFLGITYGMLAHSMGFSIWYPMSMALFIYSGAAEFLALGMLLADFNPIHAACIALVVGARHLFYGISMLDRYRNTGWRKAFLIFWMSDETFAVNYNAKGLSPDVMLCISALDCIYWLAGGFIGYMSGTILTFELKGLEFVITAMFTTIFTDQYIREKNHSPAWIGIGATLLWLWLAGSKYFILPSMLCIIITLTLMRKRTEDRQ